MNTNTIVARTQEQRAALNIWGIIKTVQNLQKVRVELEKNGNDIKSITIMHEQMFVPDFRMEWCSIKKHFRVYIYVASKTHGKEYTGYSICTIGSGLVAVGFVTLYSFLVKNRANNKDGGNV